MAEEQTPEVKAEARKFMEGLVGKPPPPSDFTGDNPIDMATLKALYKTNSSEFMEKFWSTYYDPSSTSIWTMVYDEADFNETLEQTSEIVKDFMKKTESINDHCFGVVHILGKELEIKGLWVFNGEDPETLFGANEDTSWFTWAQLGPYPNDLVKKAASNYLSPEENKLHGKEIRNTQAFC